LLCLELFDLASECLDVVGWWALLRARGCRDPADREREEERESEDRERPDAHACNGGHCSIPRTPSLESRRLPETCAYIRRAHPIGTTRVVPIMRRGSGGEERRRSRPRVEAGNEPRNALFDGRRRGAGLDDVECLNLSGGENRAEARVALADFAGDLRGMVAVVRARRSFGAQCRDRDVV
jgi:hypothetical protein